MDRALNDAAHAIVTRSILDEPFREWIRRRWQFASRCADRRPVIAIQGSRRIDLAMRLSRCDVRLVAILESLADSFPFLARFEPGTPSQVIVQYADGRAEPATQASFTPRDRVSRVRVVTGDPDGDADIVAVATDECAASWAHLASAEVSILACVGQLSDAQRFFLASASQWDLALSFTLVQHDGDAAQADANGLAARSLGIDPAVVLVENDRDGRLESWFSAMVERLRAERVAGFASHVFLDGARLLDMQIAERSALDELMGGMVRRRDESNLRPSVQADDSAKLPRFLGMAEDAAGAAEQSLREALRLRESRWPKIEAEARRDIDHYFQSAGPIMRGLEAELGTLPLFTVTGWRDQAARVNRSLAILGGLATAEFHSKLSGRVQTLRSDMFQQVGAVHLFTCPLPVHVACAAMPEIQSPSAWFTYLGGAIKFFISKRAAPVPRTGLSILDSAVERGNTVIGVATGVHQFEKSVQDDLQSQSSLKMMPYLSSLITPSLNEAISQAASAFDGELVEIISTYAADQRWFANRCAGILELATQADGLSIFQSGTSDIESSNAEIKTQLARILASRSEWDRRRQQAEDLANRLGRNLAAAECALTTQDAGLRGLLDVACEAVATWAARRFRLDTELARLMVNAMFFEYRRPAGSLGRVQRVELHARNSEASRVDYHVELTYAHGDAAIRTRLPLPVAAGRDHAPAAVRRQLLEGAGAVRRLIFAAAAGT